MTNTSMYDMLVIGGGINGVGIARDAAGRGLNVLLCEKDDLATHTSSSSTKLIHGGLRYLEQYEFRLVREALIEREVLLRAAPHIIWPLRFCLPYDEGLRPAWLLRLGLFLYDHIGGRKLLPPTSRSDLAEPPHRTILQDRLTFGFEYSDCWVEDSRLVVLNAMDFVARGGEILTRTACSALRREGGAWRATLTSPVERTREISAKAVINAAGPWVDDILGQVYPRRNARNVRLVKGSHIVTEKLYDGDHCYIFQNSDNRIVFAIPYEQNFTLIGTTDLDFSGDQDDVKISKAEISYLCAAASEYFAKPVTKEQIVWTFAGVRPLFDDKAENNSTITRDYVFDIDAGPDQAPILSVFGGKITTYRKLAEHAIEKIGAHLHIPRKPWTKNEPLPGGDIPDADFDAFLNQALISYPWLDEYVLKRLARAYGSLLPNVIAKAKSEADLGVHFGAGLYEAEVLYLLKHEFAQTAEDILWRRTKLGLHLSSEEKNGLARWFEMEAAA